MQSPSPSPRESFGIRFSLLARRWRRALDAHLTEVGLTDATWAPLVHLQQTGGGITQKELAALVGIDGSSLVRLLDILSRQGLVERRADASDGRARLIHLTPQGEEHITTIRRALTLKERELLADISDDQLSAMLAHFDMIERRLSQSQSRSAGEKSR